MDVAAVLDLPLHKLRDRVRNGSTLPPKNEPRWHKYLNPIFSESNEDTELAAKSANVFCMNSFDEDPGNDSSPESEVSNIVSSSVANFLHLCHQNQNC